MASNPTIKQIRINNQIHDIDAVTVNEHTVESDVPVDAKFTDTVTEVYAQSVTPDTSTLGALWIDTSDEPGLIPSAGACDWEQIQKDVRAGLGPDKYPVGTEFRTVDQDTGNLVEWIVTAHDYYTPVNGQHSMTLEMKNLYSNRSGKFKKLNFSSPQAMYYAENGLSAGKCAFNIALDWWCEANNTGASYTNCYQFELTKAVPVGGKLSLNVIPGQDIKADIQARKDNGYGKGVTISSYDADCNLIETVQLDHNTNNIQGMTYLGSTDGSFPNMNHMHRILGGSNNYAQSALNQWLNSGSSDWRKDWKPQTKFDLRPIPQWKSTDCGFLKTLSEDFKAVIGDVEIPCKANHAWETPSLVGTATEATVFTPGEAYTLKNKVFIPSQAETWGVTDKQHFEDPNDPEQFKSFYGTFVLSDGSEIEYKTVDGNFTVDDSELPKQWEILEGSGLVFGENVEYTEEGYIKFTGRTESSQHGLAFDYSKFKQPYLSDSATVLCDYSVSFDFYIPAGLGGTQPFISVGANGSTWTAGNGLTYKFQNWQDASGKYTCAHYGTGEVIAGTEEYGDNYNVGGWNTIKISVSGTATYQRVTISLNGVTKLSDNLYGAGGKYILIGQLYDIPGNPAPAADDFPMFRNISISGGQVDAETYFNSPALSNDTQIQWYKENLFPNYAGYYPESDLAENRNNRWLRTPVSALAEPTYANMQKVVLKEGSPNNAFNYDEEVLLQGVSPVVNIV